MGVVTGPVDETPPHRLQVDRELRQQAGGPANHVRSGSSRGKLRQVGQPVLAEQVPNRRHALAYVRARP